MARRKKTTIAVCVFVFILAAALPLIHLSVLVACGDAPSTTSVCQFAKWQGPGQGALVSGLAVVVVIAIAILVGVWCVKNVVRAERERHYLLAKVPAGNTK